MYNILNSQDWPLVELTGNEGIPFLFSKVYKCPLPLSKEDAEKYLEIIKSKPHLYRMGPYRIDKADLQ